MHENILVAISNFTCISPIYFAWTKQDYITMVTIIFVSVASFISHLVENHKHGMLGIGFSVQTSYYLNRMDVVGCLLVGLRFIYLFYLHNGYSKITRIHTDLTAIFLILPFIFLVISEYDKYNPLLKLRYIVFHSLWHVFIFLTMGLFLEKYIY